MKLTPWQKIYRAALSMRGVRLTAEEVQELSKDDALMNRGRCDDQGRELDGRDPKKEAPEIPTRA